MSASVALALLAASIMGCSQPALPTPTPTKSAAEASKAPLAAATKAPTPAATKAPEPTKAAERPLEPPETVVVATVASVSDAGIAIANARGYFQQEGVKIEQFVVKGGVDVIGSMATGELDVASIAPTPGFYNAALRDMGIKMVVDKSHLAPGQPFVSLVVRTDLASTIKEIADLKGRAIGVNTIETGSATSAIFLRELKKAGLSVRDLTAFDLAFPEINTALGNKRIEAGLSMEPIMTTGINQGLFVRWKGLDEFSPNHQIAGLFYSPKFAQTEAAKRFMVAYLRGVRDYNDGLVKKKGWDDIVSILQEYAAIRDRSLFDQMAFPAISPDGYLNKESMTEDLKTYSEQGWLKGMPDLNKVIDMRFVEYAIARLGKYQ